MDLEYTELYRCNVCFKVFNDFETFEEHFKSKHVEDSSEKIKVLMIRLDEEIVNQDQYFFSHESRSIFNKLMNVWGDNWEEYEEYCKKNKLKNLIEGIGIVYDTYNNDETKITNSNNIIMKIKYEIFK